MGLRNIIRPELQNTSCSTDHLNTKRLPDTVERAKHIYYCKAIHENVNEWQRLTAMSNSNDIKLASVERHDRCYLLTFIRTHTWEKNKRKHSRPGRSVMCDSFPLTTERAWSNGPDPNAQHVTVYNLTPFSEIHFYLPEDETNYLNHPLLTQYDRQKCARKLSWWCPCENSSQNSIVKRCTNHTCKRHAKETVPGRPTTTPFSKRHTQSTPIPIIHHHITNSVGRWF